MSGSCAEILEYEAALWTFIDVIGCGDGDPAACLEASSFNARGCTGFIALKKDEVKSIEIQLHNAAADDLLCPPPE